MSRTLPPTSTSFQQTMKEIRINLNKSISRKISKAVEMDPSLDMEALLKDIVESYPKRLSTAEEDYRIGILKKARDESQRNEKRPVSQAQHQPISSTVLDVLRDKQDQTEDTLSLLRAGLPSLIDSGRCLHSLASRQIIQLTHKIVLKVSPISSVGESHLLNYLIEHTSIPVPTPLGHVTIGHLSYLFVTYIPGDTLKTRWSDMSIQQNITITNSLDEMLKEMRRICHAEGAPLGTLCPPHVCKHLVRALSISQPDIRTVASFHDFLLSDPYPNTSSSYLRWLRSLMKDDYRV
ncbi:hypothetical protein M422DRAFT_783517 [Sphaerobolus stellatus SS14]|uniref:Uncharacterized protein n=1 Tax=Sphaerobolus stellatus (strain SS14) TaxID=990650 RepID=A0A0C9UC62_SPHS4|nr:hypothetical protein M422DRAFT_783517 [Sphaerobolus stellatus SS14]